MQENLDEMLRALASGSSSRSETARLNDVFESVEQAIKAGVSREAILATLHKKGFTLSMKGFESALYRIRKKRSKQAEAPEAQQSAPSQLPEESRKITNPSHIRQARKREIDLDDYSS
jgi:hypothetical protein